MTVEQQVDKLYSYDFNFLTLLITNWELEFDFWYNKNVKQSFQYVQQRLNCNWLILRLWWNLEKYTEFQ